MASRLVKLAPRLSRRVPHTVAAARRRIRLGSGPVRIRLGSGPIRVAKEGGRHISQPPVPVPSQPLVNTHTRTHARTHTHTRTRRHLLGDELTHTHTRARARARGRPLEEGRLGGGSREPEREAGRVQHACSFFITITITITTTIIIIIIIISVLLYREA